MADENRIPVGYCQCGCGQRTSITTHTDRRVGAVKGQPRRFVMGHAWQGRPRPARRKDIVVRYRKMSLGHGKQKEWHLVRAERAVGHPLPSGAEVHHPDRDTWNANARLVICEDRAYHFLLHRRMRVKAAGGNPNTDAICGWCKQIKPFTEFGWNYARNLPQGRCRACVTENSKERWIAEKRRRDVVA